MASLRLQVGRFLKAMVEMERDLIFDLYTSINFSNLLYVPTYNEQELLAAMASGDRAVFRHLMNSHYPVICHFAQRFTKDSASAEDIASEAFLKLWQQRAIFDSITGIKKFLYTVTRHSCLNYLRTKSRLQQRENEYALNEAQNNELLINEVIRAEVWASVYAAISDLPEKMQQVLRLAYLEGLKNQEIADQLNISVFTVKAHKQRAVELLKLRFKNKELLPFLLLLIAGL